MSEIVLQPRVRRLSSLPRAWLVGAVVVAVAAAAIGVYLLSTASQPRHAAAPVPLNAAIEAKWGVRVSQVAQTGDGGMVDFRFIVLDPDKATEMMADVNNLPILVPEGEPNAIVYRAASMGVPHDLRAGQTYFLLYQNTNGAVKPGTLVTVAFHDLTIQHVVVR